MKRIIAIIALAVCFCSTYSAHAQIVTKTTETVSKAIPVSTQVTDARYEFIQSTISSSQAFLLDKYTGQVWRYVSKKKEFEELEREDPDTVAPDKVNYQLYLSSESSSICFLLNIHTGEIWRYLKNSGERSFQKMKMPWDEVR
mgnify:CR=1 FL=1